MSNIELYSCDSYMINLEKDIGRKLCSTKAVLLFKTKYWSGNDPNNIDTDGYVIKWKTSETYTKAAKKAKYDLFKHFLTTSVSKYLLVLEDDIYIHNGMFDQNIKNSVISKINNVLKFKEPSILYLGLSRHVTSKENNIENFFIEPILKSLPDGKPKICSGAYGFIVNRSVIPILMARIANATFKNDPFDLSSLSYVLTTQSNKVYVCHPPLVIPDVSFSNIRDNMNQDLVWDILNVKNESYQIICVGLLFVTVTHVSDFNYFRKMITMITPYIKVIYIASTDIIELCDEKISSIVLLSESDYDLTKSNYSFIMRTTTECRMQYRSGKYLLDLITKNMNKCQTLQIINGETNENMFNVTYNNVDDTHIDIISRAIWAFSEK